MELKNFPVPKHSAEDALQDKMPSRAMRPQVIIICAYVLVGISSGMSHAHTAVLLPQLKAANSSMSVDDYTGSWIASLNAGVSPLGCLLGGIAMDYSGRRKTCIVANSIFFLGWLFACVAPNTMALTAAKAIEGFARGMFLTTISILVDELANPKFRGSIICAIIVFNSAGTLTIGVLAALWEWRVVAGIATAISLLSAVPIFHMSESPSWLVRKNRLQEAAGSLAWLWGPGRETEVQEDLVFLKTHYSSQRQDGRNLQEVLKTCRAFFKPRILKPFFILHVFSTIQVLCGFFIFTYYTVDILLKMKEAAGGQIMNENLGAVAMFSARIVGNIATTLSIDRIGRRPIALVSGAASSASAVSLSAVLAALSTKGTLFESPHVGSWLVFTLTTLFILSLSFGYAVPVLMLGETQAAHVRGFVCGYIYTVNDLTLGTALKFYHSLLSNLQIHGLFLLFGISCLVCTIFVYLFLPETQGKTLEQIEDYFRQPNIAWITRDRKAQCETETVNGSPNVEATVLDS